MGSSRASLPVVGVSALQGSFAEHAHSLRSIGTVHVRLVRLASELHLCDALILPGGESTAMSIIGNTHQPRIYTDTKTEQQTFMEALRQFVLIDRKPVWGTCAGCILLADEVMSSGAVTTTPATTSYPSYLSSAVCGGRVGGIAISVSRNFFGRQSESFRCFLKCRGRLRNVAENFQAVCIRAPAILQTNHPEVEVLAEVDVIGIDGKQVSMIAAAADANVFVTIFHPELTDDTSIHSFFVNEFVLKFKHHQPTKSIPTSDSQKIGNNEPASVLEHKRNMVLVRDRQWS
eukprot:GHVS01052075.1.p1 GENE.GHVS01052075.1~~GHVS01052075.1.p1  ORF type:complete len:289 (+),score=41.37 GHVS01052075.1:61-927(+)